MINVGKTFLKLSEKEHLEECLFQLLECQHEQCHLGVLRKDYKEHIFICPKKKIDCKNCDYVYL